jgi:hypothetical protein
VGRRNSSFALWSSADLHFQGVLSPRHQRTAESISETRNRVEPGETKVYDCHSCDKKKQGALNAWGARLSRTARDLEMVKAGDREGQVRVRAQPQLEGGDQWTRS